MALKASPPPFEPKGKKSGKARDLSGAPAPKKGREDSRAGVPKTPRPTAKVIKAPKEVAAPKPLGRVTGGPYFDDRHPRPHEGWVVIVRAGDIVQYHRFRTEDDARLFAGAVNS